MTAPQDPWQDPRQGGHQQGHPQQGGYGQGHPQQGGPPQYPPHPQGYPPQGGYQQYSQGNPSAAPPVRGEEGAGPPPPVTVGAAFWVAVVVPVLATVASLISYFLMRGWFDEVMTASVRQQGVDLSSPEARQALGLVRGLMEAAAVIGVVFSAILTGLWVLFAFKMRAGRNWARVTLTVFGVIWALGSVAGLVSGGMGVAASGSAQLPEGVEMPAGVVVAGYVQNGLVLVAMAAFLVLVYLKPSNDFFRAYRYRRG